MPSRFVDEGTNGNEGGYGLRRSFDIPLSRPAAPDASVGAEKVENLEKMGYWNLLRDFIAVTVNGELFTTVKFANDLPHPSFVCFRPEDSDHYIVKLERHSKPISIDQLEHKIALC